MEPATYLKNDRDDYKDLELMKPTKYSPQSNHSQSDSTTLDENEAFMKETLDSVEKWITQQLLFHESVSAFDLYDQFDVPPKIARLLLTRFEKRTSTYDIYPISMTSAIPRSSIQPLEQMISQVKSPPIRNSQFFGDLTSPNNHQNSHLTTPKMFNNNNNLNDHDGAHPLIRSVSPDLDFYTDPYDYIDYKRKSFSSWFGEQKHKYIVCVQECAALQGIGLPEFIAEQIIIHTILLPGCYSLTGLLFPPARSESDLFAEYANREQGYMDLGNKSDKGIPYKRKKPMINVRRPENNTASLWLDEDGTICGFRCIWVHGIRGKLMVDQKFNVLQGCWSLNGEIAITFEQWEFNEEFEGYLEAETFQGKWTAGNEFYGEFQWFITAIESFYLSHNIDTGISFNSDGNNDLNNDEFDFDDDDDDLDCSGSDDSLNGHSGRNKLKSADLLHNKMFDILINESLTITAKFLADNNVLEIFEKQDTFEDEVIGSGKWFKNGKIHFKNVKYREQKLILSFDGCNDGQKVLGRLCIYHDNYHESTQDLLTQSKMQLNSMLSSESTQSDRSDDFDNEDFDAFLSMSHVTGDPDEDDDDDDDDDDDERISFVQMIVVTNIVDC